MNITVGDLQVNFTAGALTLKYAAITFNAGEWPNNISGNLQVTPEDGISLTSTEDEIKAAAKTKVLALINADNKTA